MKRGAPVGRGDGANRGLRGRARGSGRSGRYGIVGSEGCAAPVAQRRGEGRTGHGESVVDGGRVGQGGGGCALRGSFCPDHPPRRHPGLGPGSTGPQGGGKRLRPSPSPQSGPRNESGVTGLFWARFRPPQCVASAQVGACGALVPPLAGPALGVWYMHCSRPTHPVTPDLVRGPPGCEGGARGSGHPPRRGVDPGTSPG